LDPVILAFLLPTTLKRYCIQIRGPFFSRTCQACEICEIKGTRKKTGFTVSVQCIKLQEQHGIALHHVIALWTVCVYHSNIQPSHAALQCLCQLSLICK